MTREEIDQKIELVLVEARPMFKILDDIDTSMREALVTPTEETLLLWTRQAAGAGNFLLKKYLAYKAIKLNEEANKYSELKLAAGDITKAFVATTANKEASLHIAKLRTARNILEAYVESAKTIVSVCRMHQKNSAEDKGLSVHL